MQSETRSPPERQPARLSARALARAGRQTAMIIVVAVVLACGTASYFLLRDGAPWWAALIIWAMGLLFGLLAAQTFLPGADEKTAAELADSGRAVSQAARVVALQRRGSVETHAMRQTRVQLTVSLPGEGGQERAVTLPSLNIEDALLPGFATGQIVHVLVDPADPERVAIDRERSPVVVR